MQPEKAFHMNRSVIESAKETIEQEIRGLEALIDELGAEFEQAVDIIYNLKGRLIVSGMGKSGHIARKIAATLASTGTPATFVHPGEASHGDLGMITKDDAVMLLSNSGETSELNDVMYYCKRFSIPVIGVVRRDTSQLVDLSDVAIILPEIPEASVVAAPTTSTTMMLAWGDALSVALLNKRGFDKQDFHVFHPGGKLGSQFISVEKIMRSGDAIPNVQADTKMSDALLEITRKSLGCAIVCDNKKVLGVITDGDLRRNMEKDIVSLKASEVMTQHPITIKQSMLAVEALSIMNAKHITSIIVVDDNDELIGLVHIHDVLQAGVS